jgi:hypothetical protein
MMRSGLLPGLIFALSALFPAAGQGVGPVDSGLYAITTTIETETLDRGTGTLGDAWSDTYSGAACLMDEADRLVRPETFADERCSFSNVRRDPYGLAFDLVCPFPEGLLAGSGTLGLDPTRPSAFDEAFTLRGEGEVAAQRVTIRGRLVGACPP